MLAYIIRRLFLIVPTLLGIMIVNFIVIQLAPGGPVERVLAEIQGTAVDATARITGNEGSEVSGGQQQRQGVGDDSVTSKYRGAQGLDPAFIKQLEKLDGVSANLLYENGIPRARVGDRVRRRLLR